MYDYVGGKADWGSFGLPLEGEADSGTRVWAVARRDAPTCRPDELVSDVAGRVDGDWGVCVVTNTSGIVQGLLGREALRSRARVRAEETMTLGPSTLRPSARRDAVLQRMRERELTRIVVTYPGGAFAGVVRREDLE